MNNLRIPRLRIPGKNLDDNFKLGDFQGDFTDLLKLVLSAKAKPSNIQFRNFNSMDVRYEDGRLVQYRFEKRDGDKITKIINLTDNTELNINW